MKHIFISPHLDDAVLSCGGAIHNHVAAGEEVAVMTVFADDAPPDRDLSPFALTQHGYWGNPPQPMALRRAEDAAALALLGARKQHLDYRDAIYRTAANGQWLYDHEGMLWGEIHPDDPLGQDGIDGLATHLASLAPQVERCTILAPLGLGHHVDHQIVHAAAQQLLSQGYHLVFYEDYPYGEQPGALEAALGAAGAQRWSLETVPLEPANVIAKINALAYYRSQIGVLFDSAEAMSNRVWSFCASRLPEINLAERFWRPVGS